MKKLDETTFICLDCEATGLDYDSDRLIEIAAIRFKGNTILDSYETLVNPEIPIPEESIKIHNITDEMVIDKPKLSIVLRDFLAFIGNDIIVGHGVGYDIKMLEKAAERSHIACTIGKNVVLDTLRMARLYGESPVNSLEMLRKHFNIPEEGAHRAMSDVIVNVEVFKMLSKNYKTVDEIIKTLARPIRLKIMPLGKHKGRDLKEIPIEYLQWAANKDFDQDLLYSLRSEIKRRKNSPGFASSNNPFSHL